MSVTPFDSALLGPLLSDPELARWLDDRAQVESMLEFEGALARAEARGGVIPEAAAEIITEVADQLQIDPSELAAGTARDGIPVPALVAKLRQAVAKEGGDEAAQYVHWGATTQDVMDTGLVLRLNEILDIMVDRLERLGETLAGLADAERGTVMLARTRGQQATPTSFGLKAAGWLAPLQRHLHRLAVFEHDLWVLSFGGAAGNLSALGKDGPAVEAALAEELGLGMQAMPWHSQRDGIIELGNWLGLVAGSLGKMAGDILLLCQNEVGELREGGGGGGSSTMPQKSNPVRAEAVAALARHATALAGQLQAAAFHDHERDGVAWQLEWLVLPQLLVATGAALRQSLALLEVLEVDRAKMRANIEATKGLALAEAASFALAAHIPRPEAQTMVKEACQEVLASGGDLISVLRGRTDAPVDWAALGDPANHLGAAETFIDRVLATPTD